MVHPHSTLLAGVPLFRSLTDENRDELSAVLDPVVIPRGQTVFEYGDPGGSMFVIRSGQVETYFRNDTGDRVMLEVSGPGEFFGEVSLLDEGPRTATVVVTEDLEALRLDRPDLERFLRDNPSATMELLAVMGRRLRFTGDRLRHTASRNVNEVHEDRRTPVEKSADWIAAFSGSIPFILLHVVVFGAWIAWNQLALPVTRRFDPYPFGLLTMAVSLEAIFLSVFVLLSQNRQAMKDRVRSDIEYDVNLKAELEVAHLHQKLDQLRSDLLARLERLEAGQGTTKPPGG